MMVSDEQRGRAANGAQQKQSTYQAILTPFIRGMLGVLLELCVEKDQNLRSKVQVSQCQSAAPGGSVSVRTRRRIESRRGRKQRASALRNNNSSDDNCKSIADEKN